MTYTAHAHEASSPEVEAAPSGWQAHLDLAFDVRGARTVLAHNLHRGPLQVQKSLYPEGPGTCHIAILHPPGGIVAGDSLCVRAALEGGARALLTTPGAAKWYRSEGARARQEVHFSLRDAAMLEWLPRENILFDGTRLALVLEVALGAESTYFGWEILSFGRRASGERWRRGSLQMRTCIRRAERVLWSETADVDAGSGFTESMVGLRGSTVCGTLLVAGYEVDNELLARCRAVMPRTARAHIGITRVPGVLVARYLGDSSEEGFDYFTRLWGLLRPALSARAACAPRVWAC